MGSHADSFSQVFDSIAVEPRQRDLSAFAAPAMRDDAPGFSLLDDAGGRFAIDRTTGIITLLDGELLTTEANVMHGVHVRVVEPSGSTYELKFRLRMTGLIPQIAGAEEFDALANLAHAPHTDLAPPPRIAVTPTPTEIEDLPAEPATSAPSLWPHLAALEAETAPYGLLRYNAEAGLDTGEAALSLSDAALAPAPAGAHWII
ncbi:MAG: hypothetical protein AB7P07_04475 [Hyphomonadaceae bacterium]